MMISILSIFVIIITDNVNTKSLEPTRNICLKSEVLKILILVSILESKSHTLIRWYNLIPLIKILLTRVIIAKSTNSRE
ncbi:hypothetical protein VAEU17_5150002 [Vibrio aestuarianus]|nr:hypothetical protein VAEU17_5150002 [Vibrio aestuarianus]